MTEYLDLPLRTLREVHDETAEEVERLKALQERLMERKTDAELELRFEEADALGEEHDALDTPLAPLLDRLETLEDELAWRERRNQED